MKALQNIVRRGRPYTLLGPLLALTVSLATVFPVKASPKITVDNLLIQRSANPDDPTLPLSKREMTQIRLELGPFANTVQGLNTGSSIHRIQDSTGFTLLGAGAPRNNQSVLDHHRNKASASYQLPQNGISPRRQLSAGGKSILVTLEAENRPAPDSQWLHVEGLLQVDVYTAGEQQLTFEDNHFDRQKGSMLLLKTAQGSIQCRIRSRPSEENDFTAFQCHSNDVRLIRLSARGSEHVAVQSARSRPNLVIEGAIENTVIDVTVPKVETVDVPLDITFGADLTLVTGR